MADVLVVIGSDSDLPLIFGALEILDQFEVKFEVHISSAHRSPQYTINLIEKFQASGGGVIIAAAGMSAHLAGVIAAHTVLPVLGVPLSSSDYGSLDSLLSMVEMPPGVPVGVLGKGSAGARNSALLALEILALHDSQLKSKLVAYRAELSKQIEQKDARLQTEGWRNYKK